MPRNRFGYGEPGVPVGEHQITFAAHEVRAGGPQGAREDFESMIGQLVRALRPDARTIAADPGDWGIDVVAGLLDDTVAIWQAKYFYPIVRASHKAQIMESFASARHQAEQNGYRIEEWTLCVPAAMNPTTAKWWDAWHRNQQDVTGVSIRLWDENELRTLLRMPAAVDVRRDFYAPRYRPPAAETQPDASTHLLAPAAENLVRAQHAASDELPYRLLLDRVPPLAAIYVEQISEPGRDGTAAHEIGDAQTVITTIHAQRDVVFTADAGGGKSTLLHRIVADSAAWWTTDEANRSAEPPYGWLVPVRVKARDIVSSVLQNGIAASANAELCNYLDGELTDLDFRRPPGRDLQWLVLVDGVDEILATAERQRVVTALAKRIASGDHLYRFVVASRPLSTAELLSLGEVGCGTFVLKPFDDAQLREFAESWLRVRDVPEPAAAADAFVNAVAASRLDSVAALPLLATIALIVFETGGLLTLPTSRASLYAEFFLYLLDVRQQYVRARSELHDYLAVYRHGAQIAHWLFDNVVPVLERMATVGGRPASTSDEGTHAALLADRRLLRDPLLREAANFVKQHAPQPLDGIPDWTGYLHTLLISTGIVRIVGDALEFTHRSFAEYLAGDQVSRTFPSDDWSVGDTTRVLRGLVAEGDTMIFALGRWVDDGHDITPLIAALLAGSPRTLLVAARLVSDRVCTAPDVEATLRTRLVDFRTDRQYGVAALNALSTLPDQTAADTALLRLASEVLPAGYAIQLARHLQRRGHVDAAMTVLTSVDSPLLARRLDTAVALAQLGEAGLQVALARLDAATRDSISDDDVDGDLMIADAMERIGLVEDAMEMRLDVFEQQTESGLITRAASDLAERLVLLGHREAAPFVAMDGTRDWEVRLMALRLTDFDLNPDEWDALLTAEDRGLDPVPNVFWREAIEHGRGGRAVDAILDVLRDRPNMTDLIEALFVLGAVDEGRAYCLQGIIADRHDNDHRWKYMLELLSHFVGRRKCASELADVLSSPAYANTERLSAAVALVELDEGPLARKLLLNASRGPRGPRAAAVNDLIEQQRVEPGGPGMMGAYTELARVHWV